MKTKSLTTTIITVLVLSIILGLSSFAIFGKVSANEDVQVSNPCETRDDAQVAIVNEYAYMTNREGVPFYKIQGLERVVVAETSADGNWYMTCWNTGKAGQDMMWGWVEKERLFLVE